MQELIWYVQCYGPWVSAGFFFGFAVALMMEADREAVDRNKVR